MNETAAPPKFDPIRHRRGGRPRKAADKRRGTVIRVRLTLEEWAKVEARAAETRLSLSDYIRTVMYGEQLTIKIAPVPPPEVMRQLRIMGRNLWQAIEEGRRLGFSEARQRALEEAAATIGREMRRLLEPVFAADEDDQDEEPDSVM
jgi:Mobilization protein NikA